MSRIADILRKARYRLADPDGDRWTDERLIQLVDEGQRDIAHQTRILKGETTLEMVVNQAIYALPDDVFMITRASYNGCQIEFATYDKMDELALVEVSSDYRHYSDRERRHGYSSDYNYRRVCWETATGAAVTHIIYDRRNLSEIRVYPIPDEGIVDERYTFSSADMPYAGAQLLGVVVDSDDYTLDQYNGVVVDMFDPQINVETTDGTFPFGVVTDAYEYEATVKIWYIRTTKHITADTDELETPRMFDVALQHYVVWQAFSDDFDTRHQEKASIAADLYGRELTVVKDVESKNALRRPQRRTTYRGAFE